MYYVIEAIHWSPAGHISHVRWHCIDEERGQLRRSPSAVVPVVDAAKACEASEVRVFVDGHAAHFFVLKACPDGIDAVADGAGTPLRQRLAHLPSFELAGQEDQA